MFKFEDLKAGLVEDFKINIEELKGFIENKIKECDRVIIVPHINADFDAFDFIIIFSNNKIKNKNGS